MYRQQGRVLDDRRGQLGQHRDRISQCPHVQRNRGPLGVRGIGSSRFAVAARVVVGVEEVSEEGAHSITWPAVELFEARLPSSEAE